MSSSTSDSMTQSSPPSPLQKALVGPSVTRQLPAFLSSAQPSPGVSCTLQMPCVLPSVSHGSWSSCSLKQKQFPNLPTKISLLNGREIHPLFLSWGSWFSSSSCKCLHLTHLLQHILADCFSCHSANSIREWSGLPLKPSSLQLKGSQRPLLSYLILSILYHHPAELHENHLLCTF